MADWASTDDVYDLTGVHVTTVDIKKAQALIELFSGALTQHSDAGNISTKNLLLLKRATSYQAVWMGEHPDVFTNMDTQGFSQDGASANYKHDNAHLLAPLAKRCIDRLSWAMSPLRAYTPKDYYTDTGTRDSAVRDDDLPWYPLPGSWP